MHQSTDNTEQIRTEKKQGWPAVPIVITIVACLGLILIFPLGRGEGGFPPAEYHIQILSAEGQPLPGAHMSVRLKDSTDEALGYPFDNYMKKNTLISNSQGHIVVQHFYGGLEFGSTVSLLSLLLNSNRPVYICEITATGYKSAQFNTNQLFKRAYAGESPESQVSVTVDCKQVTLNVYIFVVKLENQ